jgi:hypothetical protein
VCLCVYNGCEFLVVNGLSGVLNVEWEVWGWQLALYWSFFSFFFFFY